MSTPVFERLLYTDCRAGGGRGGSNGFQIQAQSPGVDPAQARMAVGALTYSVQEAWTTDGRPVEDFPLGFAHASDAGYGTGQSCYLGKEVTGGREGNHLADCLLTRDAEPYGAIRPAQLWRSDFWRRIPWDSTDCPPFGEFLEPGPLDNETLADWLRGEPARARSLARLVSVLDDPDGPRVVMVADEPEEALAWIAAATLLLPIRTAVAISFKVFISNLNQAQHRICAVPRSLNRSFVAGGRNPRFHFDATTGIADEFEVSARATFWVERLLAADDPYDVVDAVERAETLGGDDDSSRADAMLTAWAITASDEPVPSPLALLRWLTAASPAQLDQHGAPVVERLLDCNPDAPSLRWMDAAATSGLVAVDPARIRAALVVAEVEEARAGSRIVQQPLRRVDIDADARRDAESLAGSAILLAADDAGLDALLRVARRHSIALPLDSLRERLHAFVVRWVATGNVEYQPAEWALEDPILDMLHQQLVHGLSHRGGPALAPMIRQVWPHLIDRSRDPNEPLNWQLHAAAVEAAAPGRRVDAVQASFTGLTQDRYRPFALDGLQQAMLDWRVVGDREALLISTLVPAGLPLHPDIEALAVRAAERGSGRPDAMILSAINALDRRGLLLPDELSRLHDSDVRMRQIAAIARNVTNGADERRLAEALELAHNVDAAVAATWMSSLVRVSLTSRVSWLGAILLRYFDDQLALRFLACWSDELAGPQGAGAAAYGVSWYVDPDLRDSLRPAIAQLITSHLQQLASAPREQFVALVRRRHLTGDMIPTWDSLVDPGRGQQRRSVFSREKNR